MADLIAFRKTSLVDYPGRVAATLFFPGCNLRCPWCHNRELVLGLSAKENGEDLVTFEAAFGVIGRRRAVLGGVVFTGGEALLRRDIAALVERVKDTGLPVKLDTNGTRPDALGKLLGRKETAPDYIAMDLKLAPGRGGEIGAADAEEYRRAVEECAALVAASGIAHEYRSLALPDGFFGESDVEELAPFADGSPWYFSAFRPGNCLDDSWNGKAQSARETVERMAAHARSLGKDGRTR